MLISFKKYLKKQNDYNFFSRTKKIKFNLKSDWLAAVVTQF